MQALAFLLVAFTDFVALGQHRWDWQSPNPRNNSLNAIAWLSGEFVIVGDGGTISISADGASWTQQKSGTRKNLNGIAEGNNVRVAVGENGTITRSVDGQNWTLGNSGVTEVLNAVAFGNGKFVAVGGTTHDASIVSSEDGAVWTTRLNDGPALQGVAFGNGRFVAVGDSGSILTSIDGATWEAVGNVGDNLQAVTFADDRFITGGQSDRALTSEDGVTWTRHSAWYSHIMAVSHGRTEYGPIEGGDIIIRSGEGVAWTGLVASFNSLKLNSAVTGSDGLILFVGEHGRILSTRDAKGWSMLGSDPVYFSSVARGNGIYVGVNPNVDYTAVSSDLRDWRYHRQGFRFNNVAFGKGVFVATTGTAIHSSVDGVHWTLRDGGTVPSNQQPNIKYSDGRFLATFQRETAISDDGITWKRAPVGTGLSTGAYGNGHYVVAGPGSSGGGEIHTSSDGLFWTRQNPAATGVITAIQYGNGVFVGIGSLGRIFTSVDGITWVARTSGTSRDLLAITWGNGRFAVTDTAGALYTSDDGAAWVKRTVLAGDWVRVHHDGGQFVVFGKRIATSADGVDWAFKAPFVGEDFIGVATGDDASVAITESMIFRSSDGVNWTPQVEASQLSAVDYANGKYFVGAARGWLFVSSDGVNWTGQSTGAVAAIVRVVHGNGVFVAISNSVNGGEVLTSPDGLTWSVANPAVLSGELEDIAFGAGLFVAVGYDRTGHVMTSSNGRDWTASAIKQGIPATGFKQVAYGNGQFVAVDRFGQVGRSTDGTNWSVQTVEHLTLESHPTRLIFAGGMFFGLIPYEGVLLTSLDGLSWLVQDSVAPRGLAGVAYGNGRFIAVGVDAVIVTSPQEVPLPAPVAPVVKARSTEDLSITWPSAAGAIGYRLDRKEPGGVWRNVAISLPVGHLSFEDKELLPGTVYSYRMQLDYPDYVSGYSQVVAAKTFSFSEQWRMTHFDTISDSGEASDNADPDADGVVNLFERAFGGDPLVWSQSGFPGGEASGSESAFVFTFTRDSASKDLVYEVETSTALNTWSLIARSWKGGPTSHMGVHPASIAETETVGTLRRVKVTIPYLRDQARYVRLRVTPE